MPFFGDIAKSAKGAKTKRTTEGQHHERASETSRFWVCQGNLRPSCPLAHPPAHAHHAGRSDSQPWFSRHFRLSPLFLPTDLLTGGFNYDNKYTCDVKNAFEGVKVNGAVTQKGGVGDPTGTFKAVYDLGKEISVDAEVTMPSGKVTASATHVGAVPGFKATLSGQPADASTLKLATQYVKSGLGLKCDLTDLVAANAAKCPKAEVSAAYASGDALAGVTASVDAKTGAVSKYTVAAQVVADDHTLAVVLADQMDTVKASLVTKFDRDTSVGAEVVYKMKAGTASATAGFATKFHSACGGKVAVATPLPVKGAALAPVVSLQTSGEVAASTTAAFSLQVDALTRKYKYGVQFATKC